MNVSSFFNYSEPNPDLVRPTAQVSFNFSLLSDWPHENWQTLLDLTQTLRFSQDDYVFRHGETDRAFYLVAAGQFGLMLPAAAQSGHHATGHLATVGLGAILGEQSFLDGQPRSLNAQALSEGELVRIDMTAFEKLTALQPELATALLWDLARIASLRQRQTTSLLAKNITEGLVG